MPLTNGFLDDVPVERSREFESEYLDYLRTAHPDSADDHGEEALSDELIERLREAATRVQETARK